MGTCMGSTNNKATIYPDLLKTESKNDPATAALDESVMLDKQSTLRASQAIALVGKNDYSSIQAFFRKQVEIFEIPKYNIDNEMKVTFEFLEDLLLATRNTVQTIFEGHISEQI